MLPRYLKLGVVPKLFRRRIMIILIIFAALIVCLAIAEIVDCCLEHGQHQSLEDDKNKLK